jgi:hypothetical protein
MLIFFIFVPKTSFRLKEELKRYLLVRSEGEKRDMSGVIKPKTNDVNLVNEARFKNTRTNR